MYIEIIDGDMRFHLFDPELENLKLIDKAIELQTLNQCNGAPSILEIPLKTTFGDLDGRSVFFPFNSMIWPSKRLLLLHAHASWLYACTLNPNSKIPPSIHDVSGSDLSGDE